jgi:hypothetical protein
MFNKKLKRKVELLEEEIVNERKQRRKLEEKIDALAEHLGLKEEEYLINPTSWFQCLPLEYRIAIKYVKINNK